MILIYNYYNENNFEAGKVIVALNKNYIYSGTPTFYSDPIFNEIGIEKIEELFHSKKIANDHNIDIIILIYLKNKEKSAVIDAIEKLSNSPYVVYAEPDYYTAPYIIPNDQYFSYLWGMKQIKSPLAWNYTIGSSTVVVGVIDSGIDNNHPDIKDNMWIAPTNRDINEWNLINGNNSMDETGHGTHVAGTIGAVGNNFFGVTGTCWNVKLAPLKIGSRIFGLASAIKAIEYANIHNITILNNSWGGRIYSPLLKLAIEEYDGLFIVSAGNDGTNNDYFPAYPASYDSDNIISVAATNQNGTLASFSNYGSKSVDIAAPGTNIFSTSLYGEYSYMNGTSMSAPHVSGAAALLKSYAPNLTSLEIKTIILSSVNKNPNLYGKILTSGILDVYAMLKMASQ